MKKQLSLIPKTSKQHGGSLAIGKRRAWRPLNTKCSLHVTLKSHHAIGGRCLLRHVKLIRFVMRKACKLFHVRVYEYAICGNHIHLLIKGPDRESIQNFFRVFAGHTAQNILKICPVPKDGGGAPRGCKKNQKKFWGYLIYSRIVAWGRDFKSVTHYIKKNVLEALNLIAYMPRYPKSKPGRRTFKQKHMKRLLENTS